MVLLALGIPVIAFIAWERSLARHVSDRLLRLFLAVCGTLVQITAGLTLLGWIGGLDLGWACLLQAGVSAGLLGLGLARRGRPVETPAPESAPRLDRWALIAVILLSLPFAARMVFYAATLTPYDYDGLTYHLPPMVEAVQAGRFVVSDTLGIYGNGYPKSVEMAFLWFLLLRTPELVLFGQMLFLPMGILAVALIARHVGLSTPLALASGLLLLSVPIVITQVTTAYIDVATGCILLAALALSLLNRYGSFRGAVVPLLTLAMLGLLVGAKYNGLALAGLLGIYAFSRDLLRRELNWGHALGVLLALPGLSWYIANLIRFGNPIWPMAVPGLEELFPYKKQVHEIMIPNTPPEFLGRPAPFDIWQVWKEEGPPTELYTYDSRYAGLGPQWFTLFLPSALFWFLLEWLEGRGRRALELCLVLGVFYVVTPAQWWTRYTWWIVAAGIVAFVSLWRRSPRIVQVYTAAVLVACMAFVFIQTSTQYHWTWDRFARALQGETAAGIQISRVLETVAQLHGETIALEKISVQPAAYYLYGHDQSNRVVLVKARTREELLGELRRTGATLFVTMGSQLETDKLVVEWPDCFQAVAVDPHTGWGAYRPLCR